MDALRTNDGKAVLYERATGHRVERWPVDAREILRAHADVYTTDPAECVVPAQAADDQPAEIVAPDPHVAAAAVHNAAVLAGEKPMPPADIIATGASVAAPVRIPAGRAPAVPKPPKGAHVRI